MQLVERAEEQVAFPVPGHRPVVGLGGPFGDVDACRAAGPDRCSWSTPRGRRVACPRRRYVGQFLAQRAAGLHEQRQVDRLVRHLHLRVDQGTPRAANRAICCGDHCSRSLSSHHRPQLDAGRELRRLRSPHHAPSARSSARAARYRRRPPLRATSRHTVDGARPNPRRDRPQRHDPRPDRGRSPPARPTTTADPSGTAPAAAVCRSRST